MSGWKFVNGKRSLFLSGDRDVLSEKNDCLERERCRLSKT